MHCVFLILDIQQRILPFLSLFRRGGFHFRFKSDWLLCFSSYRFLKMSMEKFESMDVGNSNLVVMLVSWMLQFYGGLTDN